MFTAEESRSGKNSSGSDVGEAPYSSLRVSDRPVFADPDKQVEGMRS